MLRTTLATAAALVILVASTLFGCGKSTTQSQSPQKMEAQNQNADATAQGSQDPKIAAELAKLSAEDRALATKQKTCPVTGELLGSMGAPIKIDVKGQPVFICCEGCKEDLLAKPDEYLAKLNK